MTVALPARSGADKGLLVVDDAGALGGGSMGADGGTVVAPDVICAIAIDDTARKKSAANIKGLTILMRLSRS
jgi:hypothetical protein